jgi:hypothetical protein
MHMKQQADEVKQLLSRAGGGFQLMLHAST